MFLLARDALGSGSRGGRKLTFLDLLTAVVTRASVKALPEDGSLKATMVGDGAAESPRAPAAETCQASGGAMRGRARGESGQAAMAADAWDIYTYNAGTGDEIEEELAWLTEGRHCRETR